MHTYVKISYTKRKYLLLRLGNCNKSAFINGNTVPSPSKETSLAETDGGVLFPLMDSGLRSRKSLDRRQVSISIKVTRSLKVSSSAVFSFETRPFRSNRNNLTLSTVYDSAKLF